MKKILTFIMAMILVTILSVKFLYWIVDDAEVDSNSGAKYAVSTKTVKIYGDGKTKDNNNLTVYSLGNRRTYGYGGNSTVDFEAFYGINLKTNGKTVTITTYDHTKKFPKSSVLISKMSTSTKEEFITSFDDIDKGTTVTYTVADKGIYSVSDIVDENDLKMTVRGYFYYDGKNLNTCRTTKMPSDKFNAVITHWNNLMGDADPKNYLSNRGTTYPTSGEGDRCVHVDEFEKLADEILTKTEARKTYSDEMKVFVLVDYLTKNFAYDNYRVYDLNMVSRANIAGIYNDDKYYMYGNHVGVCWDFANALTIMIRHAGIPCTSVESDNHTAIAVYLNDEWVMIDATQLMKYSCNTKDTNKDNWKYDANIYLYSEEYGTYDIFQEFDSHDNEIWNKQNIERYREIAGK